jgi:hypothetical protein
LPNASTTGRPPSSAESATPQRPSTHDWKRILSHSPGSGNGRWTRRGVRNHLRLGCLVLTLRPHRRPARGVPRGAASRESLTWAAWSRSAKARRATSGPRTDSRARKQLPS